jgi:hypothetical protein
MNDTQVKAHGHLSNDIFYFLEWSGKTGKHITVDYTGAKLEACDTQRLKINLLKNSHPYFTCKTSKQFIS